VLGTFTRVIDIMLERLHYTLLPPRLANGRRHAIAFKACATVVLLVIYLFAAALVAAAYHQHHRVSGSAVPEMHLGTALYLGALTSTLPPHRRRADAATLCRVSAVFITVSTVGLGDQTLPYTTIGAVLLQFALFLPGLSLFAEFVNLGNEASARAERQVERKVNSRLASVRRWRPSFNDRQSRGGKPGANNQGPKLGGGSPQLPASSHVTAETAKSCMAISETPVVALSSSDTSG
jgi:hypothetical protein